MSISSSCVAAMLFCLSLTSSVFAQTELPPNLHVADIYREFVQSIGDRSPTFEAQLRRIEAEPDVSVHLGIVPRVIGARAMTQMVRQNGTLIAWIEVARLDDVVELIAHELEHVIERIDGVNLAAGADAANSGIYLVSKSGMVFETERASRAGVTVAAEVRASARRPI